MTAAPVQETITTEEEKDKGWRRRAKKEPGEAGGDLLVATEGYLQTTIKTLPDSEQIPLRFLVLPACVDCIDSAVEKTNYLKLHKDVS